ncbi:hypothetical protein REPUB_Repub12eG0085500 [Reevesia pubescens]
MEKCYEKFQNAGIQPNIKTFNILLDSYGKTGNYEKMSAVMEYMQKYHYSWTIVTYNVVIDAFGRAGDLKQMEYLFRLMRSERIKPSCVTLFSLVRAYGQAGKAEKIAGVLRFIENSDILLDVVFFNCLVDAYGRLGCFAEMKGSRKSSKFKTIRIVFGSCSGFFSLHLIILFSQVAPRSVCIPVACLTVGDDTCVAEELGSGVVKILE